MVALDVVVHLKLVSSRLKQMILGRRCSLMNYMRALSSSLHHSFIIE